MIGYYIMILTKSEPFTKEEIAQLQEQFGVYIKTVIDIECGICSAGASRHFELEKILLDGGSKQSNVWGGGIDIMSRVTDYNSFINIRPQQDNTSNEVLDPVVRTKFENYMKSFFIVLYG